LYYSNRKVIMYNIQYLDVNYLNSKVWDLVDFNFCFASISRRSKDFFRNYLVDVPVVIEDNPLKCIKDELLEVIDVLSLSLEVETHNNGHFFIPEDGKVVVSHVNKSQLGGLFQEGLGILSRIVDVWASCSIDGETRPPLDVRLSLDVHIDAGQMVS
jgi:hypothetical protein